MSLGHLRAAGSERQNTAQPVGAAAICSFLLGPLPPPPQTPTSTPTPCLYRRRHGSGGPAGVPAGAATCVRPHWPGAQRRRQLWLLVRRQPGAARPGMVVLPGPPSAPWRYHQRMGLLSSACRRRPGLALPLPPVPAPCRHFGVVRALLDANLLPRVVSGSSAGSIGARVPLAPLLCGAVTVACLPGWRGAPRAVWWLPGC